MDAQTQPDAIAIRMAGSGETLTYAELEARSNQVAQLLRARGLARGDTLVLLLENCLDYLMLVRAAGRAGLYFVAMSTKLTADEAGYIVRDSGARAVIASARFADVAAALPEVASRFSHGGDIAGFEPLEAAIAAQPATPIADESMGSPMLYSSGSTGRPKGVKRPLTDAPIDGPPLPVFQLFKALYGFDAATVYLSPAPLYHAAPLSFCMAIHAFGGTVVVMEKFEPEAYLAAVEHARATHTQLVPTMFVRLLKLPDDARTRHDLSSLRVAVHAAAPCAVDVKTAMLDWWGDVVFEYYGATEAAGFTAISPQEWRAKPGSVGRALLGEIRVVGDDGARLGAGETGRIFFHGGPPFSYHNDPEKTASVMGEHGATFGDIGHVDADGYLYLTDRASYMIISGGVNIYPQEAENVLIMHPAVADVAVFGIPDPEMGEAVHAVVQPAAGVAGDAALAAELIAFARSRLSHVKCPRSVDFMAALPRHDTGKLYKRLLKDRYWA